MYRNDPILPTFALILAAGKSTRIAGIAAIAAVADG